MFFSQCSITKKIPENKYLLIKTKISCDSKVDIEDMQNYIRQKPNRKTFLIKYHLRMYYLFQNSNRKIGTWFRETVGEEPALYDSTIHKKTIQQLQLYMNERGYYNAEVKGTTKLKGIRKKKIALFYTVKSGDVYTISKITYNIPDTNIAKIITDHLDKSLIKKETVFDISILKDEQKRISQLANTEGYYSFNESNIYYTADTSKGHDNVEITIALKPNNASQDGSYKKYRIRNTYIYPDYNASESIHSLNILDTIRYSKSINFICNDTLFVKPEVIQRSNYIINGSLYNIGKVEKTQRQLSQNKLFKLVTITFTEVNTTNENDENYIDCYIHITPFTRQALTLEIEGTNTGGDWGAEINGSYIHKNLFRGAENFYIKARASEEYNKALKTNNESYQLFNSHEFGIEFGLETPVFLSPIKPARFDYNYRPKTNIRFGYNYNKTVDYTRPSLQVSYGYTWFGNNYITHNFKPIDISYIYYFDKSARFYKFINSQDYYKFSYEDYVIYAMNYAYIFYNRNPKFQRNYQYFKFFIESSGNSMYAAYSLIDKNKQANEKYTTLNVGFAQYAKAEADFRYYQVLDKKRTIVYRIFGGMAVPYLNSEGLPSVKKYYSGGANSMRAWSNRTLGPGSFKDTINSFQYYMGDIKLEANLETRFHMFWLMDGAFFIDAGNIWSYKDNEIQGAEFFANTFLKEIAIGTGYGVRFDFSFLIFRLDLGVKVKEPYLIDNTNSRIIWGNRPLDNEDFNLNLGIGYPF